MIKRTITAALAATVILALQSAPALAGCAEDSGNGMYHVLTNSCGYPVIIQYWSNDYSTLSKKTPGLTNRVGAHQSAITAVPVKNDIQWAVCNYNLYIDGECKF